ncbi:hypothetical protein ASPCAL05632 [Aspergillus calidoustus]|uniref:Uncharacterized protein n=1 Tax=Aspergillus calidoustus TaxID=454130 RepID=A0A0U5G085_ASPCI|nr:hypothetical protein ASPCAL05632 [Aspergillus calidoustus]
MANLQANNDDIIVFIARVSNRYRRRSVPKTCKKLINGPLREAKRLYHQAYGIGPNNFATKVAFVHQSNRPLPANGEVQTTLEDYLHQACLEHRDVQLVPVGWDGLTTNLGWLRNLLKPFRRHLARIGIGVLVGSTFHEVSLSCVCDVHTGDLDIHDVDDTTRNLHRPNP